MIPYYILTTIVLAFIFILAVMPLKNKQNNESTIKPLNSELYGCICGFHNLYMKDTTFDKPEGVGEFGYDISNPIPVNIISGSTDYLRRLRTVNGNKIQYERIGFMSAPNLEKIIDHYKIFYKRTNIGYLYFNRENKSTSVRAPKGYKLINKFRYADLKELFLRQLAYFITLLLFNVVVITIGIFFIPSLTILNCLLYSLFNSCWMTFTIIPILKKMKLVDNY